MVLHQVSPYNNKIAQFNNICNVLNALYYRYITCYVQFLKAIETQLNEIVYDQHTSNRGQLFQPQGISIMPGSCACLKFLSI